MALYGVSILFVALIFVSCLANYHFGTNLSTLLLRKSQTWSWSMEACSLCASFTTMVQSRQPV